jgi:nitrate reductase molybdenum cofactor assembly chaperone
MPQQLEQSIEYYPLLGVLLEYPGTGFAGQVADAMDHFVAHPDIAAALRGFQSATRRAEAAELEELYTRTFLVTALCTLYVSVHLFGAENRKRGMLMTGLAETYDRAGFDRGSELPDFLPTILRFFPLFTGEERGEMAHYCLLGPVKAVEDSLARADNPYRHVLRAIHLALSCDFPEEDLSC